MSMTRTGTVAKATPNTDAETLAIAYEMFDILQRDVDQGLWMEAKRQVSGADLIRILKEEANRGTYRVHVYATRQHQVVCVGARRIVGTWVLLGAVAAREAAEDVVHDILFDAMPTAARECGVDWCVIGDGLNRDMREAARRRVFKYGETPAEAARVVCAETFGGWEVRQTMDKRFKDAVSIMRAGGTLHYVLDDEWIRQAVAASYGLPSDAYLEDQIGSDAAREAEERATERLRSAMERELAAIAAEAKGNAATSAA